MVARDLNLTYGRSRLNIKPLVTYLTYGRKRLKLNMVVRDLILSR